MYKILLLLSLIILFVSITLRRFYADRSLLQSRRKKLSHDASHTARKMLDSIHHESVKIKLPNQLHHALSGSDVIGKKHLSLPRDIAQQKSVNAHGLASLRVGLYLLSLNDPKAINQRRWAIRFGHAFPIFTTLVVVFAVFATKLYILWAISIIITSLAAATMAQLLTLKVERQASDLACILLEKKRIFPRADDESAVVLATRAWAWHGLLPGILARFIS